ncbi:MAG: hypothetical protein AAF196_02955 [Planctomycetota bacterium]
MRSRRQVTPANYHDVASGHARRGLPAVLTVTFDTKPRSLIEALVRHYAEFRQRPFSSRLSRPFERIEQVVYERAPRFDFTNTSGSASVVLRATLTSPQPTE